MLLGSQNLIPDPEVEDMKQNISVEFQNLTSPFKALNSIENFDVGILHGVEGNSDLVRGSIKFTHPSILFTDIFNISFGTNSWTEPRIVYPSPLKVLQDEKGNEIFIAAPSLRNIDKINVYIQINFAYNRTTNELKFSSPEIINCLKYLFPVIKS